MPGAVWSEAEMATNPVGTALIEKMPVAVAGNQHFFIRNRGLAGIGMPKGRAMKAAHRYERFFTAPRPRRRNGAGFQART